MPLCPIGAFVYTIRPGDSLWQLAKSYNTTIDEITALNPGIDPYNLFIGQQICIRPTYGQFQVIPVQPPAQFKYPLPSQAPTQVPVQVQIKTPPRVVSEEECNVRSKLRSLWEQHDVWTRAAIMSIIFGLPDADAVTKRLLRNPKDFETFLRPYYGNRVASGFSDLLAQHLTIASDIVKASKAGDTKAAAEAESKWYDNADEIAAYLAGINPYWDKNDWERMLHEHLALVKQEAVDILGQNYAKSINTYDELENQSMEMADLMLFGLYNQFPDKFK
jgi:LysM repeat protein